MICELRIESLRPLQAMKNQSDLIPFNFISVYIDIETSVLHVRPSVHIFAMACHAIDTRLFVVAACLRRGNFAGFSALKPIETSILTHVSISTIHICIFISYSISLSLIVGFLYPSFGKTIPLALDKTFGLAEKYHSLITVLI